MRETPSVVPDRIEPVVAYRHWITRQEGILGSCGWSKTIWKPLVFLTATHIFDNLLPYNGPPSSHDISDCKSSFSELDRQNIYKCGIHAMKVYSAYSLLDFLLVGEKRTLISGQVYLWGLIVEHELGYRAEYAYPKCLYLDGAKDDTIRIIASNYRIPAVEPPIVTEFTPDNMPTLRVPNAISRDTGV